jgi:hypothetical protein
MFSIIKVAMKIIMLVMSLLVMNGCAVYAPTPYASYGGYGVAPVPMYGGYYGRLGYGGGWGRGGHYGGFRRH